MLGFAILLAFNLAGAALQAAGVPLPGPVLGLVLLAVALSTGLIKLAWVEDAADTLLRHMLLFFAPVVVGVLPLVPLLQQQLAPILITLAGSTVAVLLVTGWTATLLLKKNDWGASDGG